jgi:O-antigen/teichoic acid export membrane protein
LKTGENSAGNASDGGAALAAKKAKVFHTHALILVVSLSSASVLNLLFIRFVGTHLSVAELGIFFSAQSILMISGAVGAAVQISVAGGTAHINALSGTAPAARFAMGWLRKMGWWALAAAVLSGALSVPVSAFLHFPTPSPFLAMGLAATLYVFVPVLIGAFQGLQWFVLVGAIYLLDVGFRLLTVWTMQRTADLDGTGAVGSIAVGFLVILLLFGARLARASRRSAGSDLPEEKHTAPREWIPVAAALLSLSSFTFLDVLVVQKAFGGAGWGGAVAGLSRSSGVYGAAAYIGRSLILVTLPLVTVAFPKVRTQHTLGKSALGLLLRTLASVGAVALPLGLGVFLFAAPVSNLLFPGLGAAPLVRSYVLAILPYVFLTVLVYHNLAARENWAAWILPGAVAVQVGGYLMFHGDPQEVVAVLGWTGGALCLLLGAVTALRSLRGRGNGSRGVKSSA